MLTRVLVSFGTGAVWFLLAMQVSIPARALTTPGEDSALLDAFLVKISLYVSMIQTALDSFCF